MPAFATASCAQAAQRAAACAAEWPAAPQALYLLISCDVRGVACISAYGQLQLATLDVRAAAGLAGGAVQVGHLLGRAGGRCGVGCTSQACPGEGWRGKELLQSNGITHGDPSV